MHHVRQRCASHAPASHLFMVRFSERNKIGEGNTEALALRRPDSAAFAGLPEYCGRLTAVTALYRHI